MTTFLAYLDEVKARCEEATGTFHESYDARKLEQAARIMWEALSYVAASNTFQAIEAREAISAVEALIKP